MLFDDEILKIVDKAFQITKRTGTAPFSFNRRRRRMEQVRSTRFKCHFLFNTILLWIGFVIIIAFVHVSSVLSRRRQVPDSFWMFWVVIVLAHCAILHQN